MTPQEAFLLGFSITREGFNAECPYDYLAPSISEDVDGMPFDEFRGYMLDNPAYIKLRDHYLKEHK